MPKLAAPPRNELSALSGSNERIVRYLEALAPALEDLVTLTGSGAPAGVPANRSRLYIDIDNNILYMNTDPEYGASTGWVAV